MAVNDVLAFGMTVVPPATNSADIEFRAGASTDNEAYPVASFDATTSQKLDFHGRMSPKYTGGAMKVSIPWMAATATTGNVTLAAAFRRRNTTDDATGAHTYTEQSATVNAPGTLGFTAYTEIAFTSAQIDGLLAGESFTLRIRRDVADTMAGDAQILCNEVMVIET